MADRQNRIDALLAVAVFAVSLGLLALGRDVAGHEHVALTVANVALTAVSTLPLVLRRRAPRAVFVLTVAACVALRLLVTPPGPPVGPTVALYTLAAVTSTRAALRVNLALAVGAVVAISAATGLTDGDFPTGALLFATLVWTWTWLAGSHARRRADHLAGLEERAREQERLKIARDLHDSAGHAINVILVHAGAGRLSIESDADAARRAFATIEDVARQTVGEIEHLVAALRDDDPGETAPPGFAAFGDLLARHQAAGLDVVAHMRGDPETLPPAVDRGAYRILQEALTNAARHGAGTAIVDVEVTPAALTLAITNPVAPRVVAAPKGGHGLIGMRERAAQLGGHLETSRDDGRFRVAGTLPAR